MHEMIRAIQLTVACVAVLVATSAQVQAGPIIYDTITVGDNLTVADLTSNGWTTLYSAPYFDRTMDPELQSWLGSGFEYLMLGGTIAGTGQIQLAGVIRAVNIAPYTFGNATNTFPETSNYWYNRQNSGSSD
jgi:hypothetical protein